MWRGPFTSYSSLTPSLSSSGGGSSGKGRDSEQVGLHQRWDVKSWHTIGHESLEARAVYQRGRQETTGPGFTLAATIFREPAWLWWFSCSPMAAFLSVLDCVCLGQSARGTLPGSVSATEGDASISWVSTACSGYYSHFVRLLPAVWRHVYGQLGHRDPIPWQQLLTEPTNGVWSGLRSWVNRTFILQQQIPFVWFLGSLYLDIKWCLQPRSRPRVFRLCVDIIPLLTHSCWTQCIGHIHLLKNFISVFSIKKK